MRCQRMGDAKAELVCHLASVASASEARIRHWLNASEEFREMFDDHRECREMVRTWRSTLARRAARLDELEKRSRELEAQLVRFLQANSGSQAPPRTSDGGHAKG